MLDSDLAMLFGYETKNLNRQVNRNIERFPENYCFQLSGEEYKSLRCQIVTLKNSRGEHKKYLPYVFTEYGITMLTGILKSEIAVEMSIKIVNAFITMKKFVSTNLIEQNYYNNMIIKHDAEIKLLQESFKQLNMKDINSNIFFEGQIYDAYSLMMDILNLSKDNIIIIDNYIDKKILDILSKINKKIILVTNEYNNNDFNKYKQQYNNIDLHINDSFHDRFIIIDRKVLYHCGSSFKDLGKKCFAITKIEDNNYLNELLKKI